MFLKPNALSSSERSDVREIRRLLEIGERTLRADDGKDVHLPDSVCTMLKQIVGELDSGNGISMVPVGPELTVRQGATLLGVSRPALARLLEAGDLPYHKTGSHLRIYLEDVLRYVRRRDEARRVALDHIAGDEFDVDLHDRSEVR